MYICLSISLPYTNWTVSKGILWIRLTTLHAFGLYKRNFYNNNLTGSFYYSYSRIFGQNFPLLFLSVANQLFFIYFFLFLFFLIWQNICYNFISNFFSSLLLFFFVCANQQIVFCVVRILIPVCRCVCICIRVCVCVCVLVCVSAIFNFCKITANMKLCIIKTNDYLSSPFWPGTKRGTPP